MFDFSRKKKMQVYDNLRSVMQICIDRVMDLNKDGKGKQDTDRGCCEYKLWCSGCSVHNSCGDWFRSKYKACKDWNRRQEVNWDGKAKENRRFAEAFDGIVPTSGGIALTEKIKISRELTAVEKRNVLSALSRQIPYKPKEYEDKFYACKCGNCVMMKWEKHPEVLTPKSDGLPYCLACGQRLDWREEGETNGKDD